jgi:hypothetical protein
MIKQILISLMLLVSITRAFAQHEKLDRITDSISTEGKALYRSEWASWYGTDIFVEKCPVKRPLSGGYFSYETNDNLINLFFSKDAEPVVLVTVTFGKDFNTENYKLDTVPRKLNKTEHDYYMIRMAAVKRTQTDTTFKYFKNASLNIIPLIQKDIKKAYVLTGPNENGVVIFGNDYLINFNPGNEITSIKTLHKNIIPVNMKADSGKTVLSTMHSHLPATGDFITATDICTLMLYEKFTPWGTHYVISKNDVSIWDCKKNVLVILTMDAWKKIDADQKTLHPEKQ